MPKLSIDPHPFFFTQIVTPLLLGLENPEEGNPAQASFLEN
jgi:hypothetical protein